jgi:predicted nucleic-acid-binding Zn-ribbon protein
MKKIVITVICLILFAYISKAQDIIIKKNGEEIQVKVEEVQTDKIRYKKHNNPTGPLYSINLSEVVKIKYENGSEDVFTKTPSNLTSTTSNTSTVQEQPTMQSRYEAAYNQSISQTPKEKKDSKVKFGIGLGLNVSNVNSENYKPGASMEDWTVYPRFGFNTGILLDFKISKLISIQPEFKISMKGCKREGYTNLYDAEDADILVIEDAFEEWHLNFTYLEVPVNLVFNIAAGNGNLFVGGGPYLAYGIYGKSKSSYTSNGENLAKTYNITDAEFNLFSGEYKMYDPFDWGLNLLAGYEFSGGFFIKAGYNFGLTTISSPDLGDSDKTDVKNNCFDLSIGFKF